MHEKNALLLLATLRLLLDFSTLVSPMQEFAQSRETGSRMLGKRTGVQVDATKLSNLGPMHRDSFGRASTTKAKQRAWRPQEDGIFKGQQRHGSEQTLKIFYKANKSVKPKHQPSGNSRGRSFNASQDERPTLLAGKKCREATPGSESCIHIKEQYKKQRILREITKINKDKYLLDSNFHEAEMSGDESESGETSAEGIGNALADARVDRQTGNLNRFLADDENRVNKVSNMDDLNADDYEERTVVPVGSLIDHTPDRMTEALARNVGNSISDRVHERSYLHKDDSDESPESSSDGESADMASGARLESLARSRVPFLINTVSEYIGDTQNDGDVDAASTATSGDSSTTAAYDDGDYDGELLISKSRSTYNESQANSTSNQIRTRRSHVQFEPRRVERSNPNELRLLKKKFVTHREESRHLRYVPMRKFKNYKRDRLEENSTRINDSKARNPDDEADLLRLLKNIETSKSARSVTKNAEDKPFQRYLKKLAADVRSVVGQAKDVLHDTGKVVHGLRKVISRGNVMTSFAENSVKDVVLGSDNYTLNYLEEQAVVALLDAQRAATDAKIAAEIARKAAKKAVLLTQRVKATSKDKSSFGASAKFAKEIAILAEKAENEAKDASMEENKVQASVLLMDKKLKELTSAKSLKQSPLPSVSLASANALKSNYSQSKSNKPNAVTDDDWEKELSDILSGVKIESQTPKKAKKLRKRKAKSGKTEKQRNGNVILGHHVTSSKDASEPTVSSEGKGSAFNEENITEVNTPQLAISEHQSEAKTSVLQEKNNPGNESANSNLHDNKKVNNDHDEKEWQSTEERLSEAVTLLIDQIKKRKAKSKYNGRHGSKAKPAGQALRGEGEPEDQEGREVSSDEAGNSEASRSAATQSIEEESFKHFLAKQKELEEALTGQLSVKKASKNQALKDAKQAGVESPQESGSPQELAPVYSSDQSNSQEDGAAREGEATNLKASYLEGSKVVSNSRQYDDNIDKDSASFSQATTNTSETLRHSPKISSHNPALPVLGFKPKSSTVKNQSKIMNGPLTVAASHGDEALSPGSDVSTSDKPSNLAQTNRISSSSSVDTISDSPSRPGGDILKAMDEVIQASNGTSHEPWNENSNGEGRSHSFAEDDSRSIDQKIKLIERQELEAKKKLADIHLARKIAMSPRVSSAKVLHFSDHASNQSANDDHALGEEFTGKLSKANKRRKELGGKERKEQIKNFLKEHRKHALKIDATLLHRSPDHGKKINLQDLTTKQPFDEVQLALTIAKERPNGKTDLMPLVARKSITKDHSQVAGNSLISRELPGLEESKIFPDGSKPVTGLPMSPEKDVDVLARKKTLQASTKGGKNSENKESYKNIIGEELLLKSHIFKPAEIRPVISRLDQDHPTLYSRGSTPADSASDHPSPNAISEAQETSMSEERTLYDRHVAGLRNSKLLYRPRLADNDGVNRGMNEKRRFKPRTHKPYVQIFKDVPDLDFDRVSTSLIPKQYHTEEAVERKVEKGPVSVTVHVNRNVPNKQQHVGGERRRLLDSSFPLDSHKSDDNLRSLDSIDPFGFAQMEVNGSSDAKRSSLPDREPPMRQRWDKQGHFLKHPRDSHVATSNARDINKVLGFADYRRSSIPTQSELQAVQNLWNGREVDNTRSSATPVVGNFPAFVDERD